MRHTTSVHRVGRHHSTPLVLLAPPPASTRKGNRQPISWRALVAVAFVGGVVGLAVTARDATVRTAQPVAPAAVATTETPVVPDGILRLPGRLRSESTARIGILEGGQVAAVGVAVGDRVAKGQVLAKLDDVEQRAAVAGVDAQLASAELLGLRAQRELMTQLQSDQDHGQLPELPDELLEGAAGDAQLEVLHAAAQVSKQQAALALSRKRLARRVLRAPIDGVVLARNVDPGETILASPPGPPLFVIGSDPGRLRLEVEIDERYVYAITPGPASFVVPAHGGYAFSGTIRAVTPTLDATRSPARYIVTLDVPNDDGALAADMSATVDLPATIRPSATPSEKN
jgi:HlyD family secretion protein